MIGTKTGKVTEVHTDNFEGKQITEVPPALTKFERITGSESKAKQ